MATIMEASSEGALMKFKLAVFWEGLFLWFWFEFHPPFIKAEKRGYVPGAYQSLLCEVVNCFPSTLFASFWSMQPPFSQSM